MTRGKAKSVKATEAKSKGAQVQALRVLAPIAKEVNARMASAEKADGQALDHRLAAALRLKDARATCDKAKLNFKTWCAENLAIGYETARKLAYIGASPNPSEALQDYRARNAEANKKLRANRPKALPGARPAAGQNRANAAGMTFDGAVSVLKQGAEPGRKTAAEAIAATVGAVVVPKARAARLRAIEDDPEAGLFEEFKGLVGDVARRAFVERCAGYLGGVVKWCREDKPAKLATVEELTDIPPRLRRAPIQGGSAPA